MSLSNFSEQKSWKPIETEVFGIVDLTNANIKDELTTSNCTCCINHWLLNIKSEISKKRSNYHIIHLKLELLQSFNYHFIHISSANRSISSSYKWPRNSLQFSCLSMTRRAKHRLQGKKQAEAIRLQQNWSCSNAPTPSMRIVGNM